LRDKAYNLNFQLTWQETDSTEITEHKSEVDV